MHAKTFLTIFLLSGLVAFVVMTRLGLDDTPKVEWPEGVSVEDAQRKYGTSRVEGVLFSAANKLGMATVLKERFQDRRMRIPAGDVVLRADLHAIKSQVGVTGQRRLIADGETDGHADRFWAGALAATAAELGVAEYDYRPVRSGNGGKGWFAQDEDDARDPFRPPLGTGLRGAI